MPMFLNATNADIPSQQMIAHNIALRSLFYNTVFISTFCSQGHERHLSYFFYIRLLSPTFVLNN